MSRDSGIKVFIGSSIVEFESERQSVYNFINRLGTRISDYLGIKVFICENADGAMAITRTQDEYNEKVKNSQITLFLVGSRIGDYTLEELNVAYDAYKKNGEPRIYVFIKSMEGERPTIDKLKEWLEERQLPYGTFTNLDTIKFQIFLDILCRTQGVQAEVRGGKCVINGKNFSEIKLNNVAEFALSGALEEGGDPNHIFRTCRVVSQIYSQGVTAQNAEEFCKSHSTSVAECLKIPYDEQNLAVAQTYFNEFIVQN